MLAIKKVDVIYHNDYLGNITPLFVILNHKKIKIDKIIEIKPAFSEAGGYGLCYWVIMNDTLNKLFFMQDHYELEYTVDPKKVTFPKPGIVEDPRH